MSPLKTIGFLIFVVCITINTVYTAETTTEGGLLDHDRIVGAEPIEIEDAPYQVQIIIIYKGEHHFTCGGSIIAKNVILTAGHCISVELDFKVRVGSTTLLQGGKVYNTSRKKLYDDYGSIPYLYDIALLWLTENLEYSKSVAPIALPSSDDVIKDGTTCNVTGWGKTSETGGNLNVLLQTTVPIVNQKVCKETYETINKPVTNDMICASYMEEGGKDACGGDSGSPLVANGKQWGIVTWGRGCARPKFPGVNTRVTYFRKWIDQHVIFD